MAKTKKPTNSKRIKSPKRIWLDHQLVVQYRIHHHFRDPQWINPPGRIEEFVINLLREIFGRGWDCYNSGLGGGVVTYGVLYNPKGDMTIADRDSFAQWLRDQPIRASVGLGDTEPFGSSDIMREGMEFVFDFDNLNDLDHQEAMRHFADLASEPLSPKSPHSK